MIKEFKCYTLLCDNCGADLNEDSDYSGYNDEDYNYEVADQEDWIEKDGEWFCSNCCTFDDNGEPIIDESRKDKYRKEVNNE